MRGDCGRIRALLAKGMAASEDWETGMKKSSDSAKSIDEYIDSFPREAQEILGQVRAAIRRAAPEATETIAYGIPTFVLNGNLVHFAAFKNHVGFYPTPSGIEAFRDELAAYRSAKGSVQFPIDRPMPLALIEKIVRFRAKEAKSKPPAGGTLKLDGVRRRSGP